MPTPEDTTTGQGTPPENSAANSDAGTPAAGTDAGSSAAPTDGTTLEGLSKQLEDQKSIQSGLDRRVGQLTEQLGLVQTDNTRLIDELKQSRETSSSAVTELETLKTQFSETQAQLAKFQDQAAAQGAEAQRAKMVATEFPALAPLLDAGGLPEFTDADEFRGKLQGIMGAMNISANNQYQAKMQGAKPPASPGAGSAPGDASAIRADMVKAADEGDWDRYETLTAQWYGAMDGKFKAPSPV